MISCSNNELNVLVMNHLNSEISKYMMMSVALFDFKTIFSITDNSRK